MEAALLVISVLQQLREIRNEVNANEVEVTRLCDRCLALKLPVDTILSNESLVEAKTLAFENLHSVLTSSVDFITKFREKSTWKLFTKIAFRLDYGAELTELNLRLNQSILDLSLGISVDAEARRNEDLEDLKASFKIGVEKVLKEVSGKNDAASIINALRKDITDNQRVIADLMQQRDQPLSTAEIGDLNQFSYVLFTLTDSKLEDIAAKLEKVERKEDHILEVIEDLKMTKENSMKRELLLSKFKLSHFDIDKGDFPIAKGSFGEVYLGKYQKRHRVAIKVIRNNEKDQALTDREQHSVESEMLLMDYLRHPTIVVCHGYVPDIKQVLLVLELAPYGSLWSIVSNHASFPAFPFSLNISWLCDICDALHHIHSKTVVHKDLKCENLLVFQGLTLKLCDFGLAKHNDKSSVTGAGTGNFRAPEVLKREKSTPASDMYSFGMTVVQLLTKSLPKDDNPTNDVFVELEALNVDGIVAASLFSELCRCLHQYKDQRPTSAAAAQKMSKILEQLGGDPRLSGAEGSDAQQVIEIERKAKQIELNEWRCAGMTSMGGHSTPNNSSTNGSGVMSPLQIQSPSPRLKDVVVEDDYIKRKGSQSTSAPEAVVAESCDLDCGFSRWFMSSKRCGSARFCIAKRRIMNFLAITAVLGGAWNLVLLGALNYGTCDEGDDDGCSDVVYMEMIVPGAILGFIVLLWLTITCWFYRRLVKEANGVDPPQNSVEVSDQV